MKEYFYKDIQEITKEGILFKDGYKLLFEECRYEWCKINDIEANQSSCVAQRNIAVLEPYFLFHSKEHVMVLFGKKKLLNRRKIEKLFHNLQLTLNKFVFSSYDMS